MPQPSLPVAAPVAAPAKRKRRYERPRLTLRVPMETRTGSTCPS